MRRTSHHERTSSRRCAPMLLNWSIFDGGVNFNGAVPITNATGTFSIPIFSVYHSFGFFGRSANFTASLPYGVGTFQGELVGQHRQILSFGAGGLFCPFLREPDGRSSDEA